MFKNIYEAEATKLGIDFKSGDAKSVLIKAIEKARKASEEKPVKKVTQTAAARPARRRVFNAMLHRYEWK